MIGNMRLGKEEAYLGAVEQKATVARDRIERQI